MKSLLRVLILVLVSGLLLISCRSGNQEQSGLIVNITSDAFENPHSTVMGLHLGQKALKADLPVTVFLNVAGPKLFMPGGDTLQFHDENIHALLRSMMDDGASVLVCPHCLHANGLDVENVPEGMVVAEDALLTEQIQKAPTVFSY